MNRSVPVGEVRDLGDRALLVGVADPGAGRHLTRRLDGAWPAGSVEIVGGFSTVMVALADPEIELDDVRGAVDDVLRSGATTLAMTDPPGAPDGADPSTPGRAFTIPCAFDGPDLVEVAEHLGCAPRSVVDLLTDQPLTVAVMGFSPGFAYLDGLPEALRAVPRRDSPRPVVPAGSVALANGHAAVYPVSSPGGWQLVGRTGFPLFSLAGPPYATLAPGDDVRFCVAGRDDPLEPAPLASPTWRPPRGSRPVLETEVPGWRCVLQDGGRRGVAAIGVPSAGAADPDSYTLANRLVGNEDIAGAVEITAGGARLRALGPCHIAVVGGVVGIGVDGTPAPSGQVLPLVPGQVLDIGLLTRGVRCYLSVAGGVVGPAAFGSCASDELSGIGPGPLARGQVLLAGPWNPPLGDHLVPVDRPDVDGGGPGVALRVVPGPHSERFRPDALERLARHRFVVGDDSNRVGLRLRAEGDGSFAGARSDPAELDSHGVVTGAIQVPPGGDPVVLLPDHATLGGYPVVGVVVSADHGLLGQCGPGTVVRFVPISCDEALAARQVSRRWLERAVVGHYPLSTG